MKKLFPIFQPAITLIFIFIACIIYGLSLSPAILFFNEVLQFSIENSFFIDSNFKFALLVGITLSLCYFIFGISLVLIVGCIFRVLPIKPKPGIYPLYSLDTIKWGLCGAFLRLVNLAFLSFITPTFLNVLYFKLIGAKLGKGVQINSININDPWLLEIGDRTVIGGGASVNGHTVEKGTLILDTVKIGKDCTIGAQSIIWPGCTIGDKSILATQSVLKRKSTIGDKEIWKGNPARNIRLKK